MSESHVIITDTATGKKKRIKWTDGWTRDMWVDGNFSCDCNRGLFMDGSWDHECGNTRYSIKIRETK